MGEGDNGCGRELLGVSSIHQISYIPQTEQHLGNVTIMYKPLISNTQPQTLH